MTASDVLAARLRAVAQGAFACLLAQGAGALTLDECVRAALDANPGAAAAACRGDAARAAVREAQSAFLPRVGLSAGYALTDNPPQSFMMALNQRGLNMAAADFNPNEPGDTDNVRLSAGIRYRLADGGRRAADAAAARHGAAAAEAQAGAARNELIHQVTRAYYTILQAQSFVKVREESVASIEESLRVARERFAAGSAVRTDVLNLEVTLAGAREDLIRASNGLQFAVAALNTAVGTEIARDGAMPEPPKAEPAAPPAAADPLAVGNRPELRAAAEAVSAREQALRRALREYSPTISAFGSLDADSGSGSDFERSYMAGVAAEWELFAGGQRPAAVARARAELEAARCDERRARDELALDLRQAHLGFLDAWQRTEVAKKALESAAEALRITRERYQKGAADITELLTAQVGLTATRTRDTAARYDLLIAQSNHERACGALIPKYAKEPAR